MESYQVPYCECCQLYFPENSQVKAENRQIGYFYILIKNSRKYGQTLLKKSDS